jgi:predicted transcriptional regulator
MKKVLFSLLTLIAMVAMTACGSNDTEKKLNGKWQTPLTESGQQLTMTWDLNADTHKALLSINVGMEGTDMMTMDFKGSWKASAEKITFSIDDNDCSVTFADSFKQLADASGIDLKEIEEQTLAEFKKELAGMAEEEIVEITDDTLTVKEDHSNITFNRVK